MKFFISLISVIIQMNLCQSFNQINPLIMMISESEMEEKLINGFWMNSFDIMKNSQLQELCEAVINAPLYVFEKSYKKIYKFLERTYTGITYSELIKNHYLWKRNDVPVLRCTTVNFNIFLAKYSKYEDFIIFSEDHITFCPVGFVTKSYLVQPVPEKRTDFGEKLIEEVGKNVVKSRLTSLDRFSWKKLCATFFYFLYENKNAFLTSEFKYNKYSTWPNEILCVECKIEKDEKFYIVQLPDTINEVIILSETYFTVFEILNLYSDDQASSSSS